MPLYINVGFADAFPRSRKMHVLAWNQNQYEFLPLVRGGDRNREPNRWLIIGLLAATDFGDFMLLEPDAKSDEVKP